MVNSNYMASIYAKSCIRLLTLVALLLALGLNFALANEGIKLNIFPAVGKPVYGVAEFGPSVTDPVSVAVASEAEYQKAGYTRPAFFNTANVRKLGANRYLVTTSTPVDTTNFTLILDVQFKEFRRIYPVELALQAGQVAANFAPVKEYDQPAKTAVKKVSRPAVAAVAPVPQPEPVVRQLQPAAIYTQPAPQPQIFYPPAQTQNQPVSNGAEQFPFYLVVIVLAVLILLAMFVVVLFMHKNHDSRHHLPPQHEQHSLMSDLLKALPSLIGHNHQHHQQPAVVTNAPLHLPQLWDQAPHPHSEPQPYREEPQPHKQPAPVAAPQASPVATAAPAQQPQRQVAPARSAQPARPVAPPAPQQAQSASASVEKTGQPAKPAAPVQKQEPAASNPAATAPGQEAQPPAKPGVKAHDKSEKLQLAIVYMNMGDEVMARMLLDEIGRDGSAAEQAEAKEILAKMNNQSDRPIIADKNDKI
jgi:FimV-like protein